MDGEKYTIKYTGHPYLPNERYWCRDVFVRRHRIFLDVMQKFISKLLPLVEVVSGLPYLVSTTSVLSLIFITSSSLEQKS